MPLYHFNVLGGVSDLAEEGTELPNADAALREARSLAASVVADAREWGDLGDEWRIEVTDHAGAVLFRIDVAATESPPVKAERR